MNPLLRSHPPRQTKPTTDKEFYLWWAVVRQSARDIERGHEQLALDAYEFLSHTGLWLLQYYFMLDESKAIEAVAGLVRSYNARADRNLPVATF